MIEEYKLNMGNMKGGVVVYYTSNELDALHEQAKVSFEKLLAYNNDLRLKYSSGLCKTDKYYYFNRNFASDLKFLGTHNLHSHMLLDYGKEILACLDDNDKEIERDMKKNAEFVRHCKKDNVKSADYFMWLVYEPWTIPEYYTDAGNVIDTWVARCIWKDLKSKCNLCNVSISPGRLVAHQASTQCANKALSYKAHQAGYVYTANQAIVRAVKAGTLVGEKVPTHYSIYVPEWTIKAAEIYAKNKDYAGMSFVEFVNSMKP